MKLLVAALLGVVAYVSTAEAWTITSTPAAAATAEAPRGPHEKLTKTWTIVGPGALSALHVQSMGRVFVEHDASLNANGADTVARVVVSGDDDALLEAVEVADHERDATVQIRFRNDAFEGRGHLLTHVFVATKQSIRSVTMAWSSDIIVGDDVLVQSDPAVAVALKLVGSGDFFAGAASTELAIGALDVTLEGSGDVQLLAKSLSVKNAMEITLGGSGDVAVVADTVDVDSTLASFVAGSGDVFVQSGHLKAFNLSSAIAGSGDVTYSRNGTCQQQNVVVVGSGDVSTASIVCVSTVVNLVGSGDILVQTTDNLTVSSFFLGDIRYYGATPTNITASNLFDYQASHKKRPREIVQRAKKNQYDEYEVQNPPQRTPVYVAVKTSQSTELEGPQLHYALELDAFDAAVLQHFLDQQQTVEAASRSWSPLVNVGVVAAAVLIAVAAFQSRRTRRQYHQL